jgi:2'-5' RNA ligase
VRLFIAIDLSPTLRERISNEISRLTRLLGSEDVRWVKASNIHLTLKFLGETQENMVDRIKDKLEIIASQFPSFEFQIGEFGCFPNLRKPRVIWIGVQEQRGVLKKMYQAIETDLETLGFKKEGRPFSAHLTLGRLRKNITSSNLRGLSERLEGVQIENLATEMVQEICLIRSILHPSGAEYTHLGVYRLQDVE